MQEKLANIRHGFQTCARHLTEFVGSALAFALSILSMILWGLYAWPHHFDDSSQMILNSFTSIVTYVMVFVIQNAQNRDSRAIHLKLNELILATKKASNASVIAEDMTDDERNAKIKELQAEACRSKTRT